MSNAQAQILLGRNLLVSSFPLPSFSISCHQEICGPVRACEEVSGERCGDTPNDGLITERSPPSPSLL